MGKLVVASLLAVSSLALEMAIHPRHDVLEEKRKFLNGFKDDVKAKIDANENKKRYQEAAHEEANFEAQARLVKALKKQVAELKVKANETDALKAELKNMQMRAVFAEKQAASFRAQAETDEVVATAEKRLLEAAEANVSRSIRLTNASAQRAAPADGVADLQRKLSESQKKLAERTDLLAKQAAEIADTRAATQSLQQRVRQLTAQTEAAARTEAEEKDDYLLGRRELLGLRKDEHEEAQQLEAAKREIQELRKNLTRANEAHWWSGRANDAQGWLR